MDTVPLTNTHIHTNYSFSVFESPEEAVAQAVDEGAHKCSASTTTIPWTATPPSLKPAGRGSVCPMFSMEAVALDASSHAQGL